jgi:hypothetical protein
VQACQDCRHDSNHTLAAFVHQGMVAYFRLLFALSFFDCLWDFLEALAMSSEIFCGNMALFLEVRRERCADGLSKVVDESVA